MQASLFAVCEGVSRHILIDLQGDDPEATLLSGIDWSCVGLSREAFWETLPKLRGAQRLPALPPGWQRIGMHVGTPLGDRQLFQDAGFSPRTVQLALFHEWNAAQGTTAWEALLRAQDTLRPTRLSVLPPVIVSVMALAKLGAHQFGLHSNAVARWLPNIALAERVLSPAVEQMMTAWLRGSSAAAARYRAGLSGVTPKRGLPTLRLFPKAAWEGLVAAERPEPFIMRLLHDTSEALWRDPAAWARAEADWSEDEVAAMLGLSRWDTVVPGDGPIGAAELRHLRATNPEPPPRSAPPTAPVNTPSDGKPKQRGRAVQQITRAPDVPAQPSLWEFAGDLEALARSYTPGGEQELQLWLVLTQRRGAEEARRGVKAQGRGLVNVTIDPASTLEAAEVRVEYVRQAAVQAQASPATSAGNRDILAFLRSYNPETHFMVVLFKANCDPRRLIASYAYADVERRGRAPDTPDT